MTLGGSPFKSHSFTFSQFQPEYGREFKLIKKDRRFSMKTVPLPMDAKPFTLFI